MFILHMLWCFPPPFSPPKTKLRQFFQPALRDESSMLSMLPSSFWHALVHLHFSSGLFNRSPAGRAEKWRNYPKENHLHLGSWVLLKTQSSCRGHFPAIRPFPSQHQPWVIPQCQHCLHAGGEEICRKYWKPSWPCVNFPLSPIIFLWKTPVQNQCHCKRVLLTTPCAPTWVKRTEGHHIWGCFSLWNVLFYTYHRVHLRNVVSISHAGSSKDLSLMCGGEHLEIQPMFPVLAGLQRSWPPLFFLFFSEVGWNSAGKHQEFCLKWLQRVTWGISSLWMKKKSQKTELKTILLSGSFFFKKKVFFSTVAVVHSPTWRHLVPFEMCYRSPQLTEVTPKEYSPPMNCIFSSPMKMSQLWKAAKMTVCSGM